jgi:hypothetical protein
VGSEIELAFIFKTVFQLPAVSSTFVGASIGKDLILGMSSSQLCKRENVITSIMAAFHLKTYALLDDFIGLVDFFMSSSSLRI